MPSEPANAIDLTETTAPVAELLSTKSGFVALRSKSSGTVIRLTLSFAQKRSWTNWEQELQPEDELYFVLQRHACWVRGYDDCETKYGADDVRALRAADVNGLISRYMMAAGFGPNHRIENLSGEAELDLRAMDLDDANLSRCDLKHLEGASLVGTDLSGAHLFNVYGAIYEPKKQPDPAAIAYADGLDYLTWNNNPGPIYALRKSLADNGFSDAQRKVTAAIRRHDQTWVERVLFDWTSAWGSKPLRPLKIAGGLSLLCTFVYWAALNFRHRTAGLYLVATGERVPTSKGRERVLRIMSRLDFRNPRRLIRAQARLFGAALLFSLTSLFNIGFREFNLGRWIRMIQPRDFDIRARGWLRTISGIEAVLGLALFALAILCYLGHPFD